MAKCDYCGSRIIFGGKKDGDLRFCNDDCHRKDMLVAVGNQIPDDVVRQYTTQVHMGACPKCGGPGPVDVHISYLIWSALYFTVWKNKPQIRCRSCATKSQLGNAFASLLLGWWGFPWGIIMTPVQLVRNVKGIFKGPAPLMPSSQLEHLLRLDLAAQSIEHGQGGHGSV